MQKSSREEEGEDMNCVWTHCDYYLDGKCIVLKLLREAVGCYQHTETKKEKKE